MDKEESLLLSGVRDKARRCAERNICTYTGFLSPRECVLAEDCCRREGYPGRLFGGYEDAERNILVFLPDYLGEDFLMGESSPLALLRARLPKGAGPLSHRDYLGALLSLGVDRSVAGDILVQGGGADIVVLREMADFFLANLARAGRENLSVCLAPLSQIETGTALPQTFRDTLASLRLDSVVSSVFRLSRGAAQEAIRQGLVFLNNRQTLKSDAPVREGDKIALRGKGRAVLRSIGGRTRKDRLSVEFDRYK